MKIEVITKSNGKKKSKTFKTSKSSQLQKILAYMKFYAAQEVIGDVDLTTDIKFKVNGEKTSIHQLKSIIEKVVTKQKETKNDSPKKISKSSKKKKDKSDKSKSKKKKNDKKKKKADKKSSKNDNVLVMHYTGKGIK